MEWYCTDSSNTFFLEQPILFKLASLVPNSNGLREKQPTVAGKRQGRPCPLSCATNCAKITCVMPHDGYGFAHPGRNIRRVRDVSRTPHARSSQDHSFPRIEFLESAILYFPLVPKTEFGNQRKKGR